MSRLPRLGAIAVVVRDREILLIRRGKAPDAGLWGFPGGHVEPGETGLAAAARELREETGICAVPVAYLTNIDLLQYRPDGGLATQYLLAAVLCDYRGGTPRAADDAIDTAWVAIDDLRAGLLPTSARVGELAELALRRDQARRAAAARA